MEFAVLGNIAAQANKSLVGKVGNSGYGGPAFFEKVSQGSDTTGAIDRQDLSYGCWHWCKLPTLRKAARNMKIKNDVQ